MNITDVTVKQEALAVALDESVPENARLVALDDFEMVRDEYRASLYDLVLFNRVLTP
jgi:hypothetical protein